MQRTPGVPSVNSASLVSFLSYVLTAYTGSISRCVPPTASSAIRGRGAGEDGSLKDLPQGRCYWLDLLGARCPQASLCRFS